jgi:hypothetical protein
MELGVRRLVVSRAAFRVARSSARTRPPHRIAQGIDAFGKQAVSTLKKIDRKEPAPPGYECATVIGHLNTLAIF